MKSLEQRMKETGARISELKEMLGLLPDGRPGGESTELPETVQEEYAGMVDELLSLYEQQNLLMKEKARDRTFDGYSPSLTKAEERAFFRENAIRNKADILTAAEKIRDYYRSDRAGEDLPQAQLMTLLDRFSEEVSHISIMDLTQDWWQYSIEVTETEISLSLVKAEIMYDYGTKWYEKNRPFLLPVEVFPLFTTRAKLLSPEDFGALYGVSGGTVRQWIRRGKLRSASKYGKEWRIPELSVVHSGEHYSIGTYSWNTELPDVPEEFAFLNRYRLASVSSVRGERDRWEVYLSDGEMEEETLPLDGKTKERLELYLLAEPLVECQNNCLGEFLTKSLPEFAHGPEKNGERHDI